MLRILAFNLCFYHIYVPAYEILSKSRRNESKSNIAIFKNHKFQELKETSKVGSKLD